MQGLPFLAGRIFGIWFCVLFILKSNFCYVFDLGVFPDQISDCFLGIFQDIVGF